MDNDGAERRQLAADVTPAEWERIRAELARIRRRPPIKRAAVRIAEARRPRESDHSGGPVTW